MKDTPQQGFGIAGTLLPGKGFRIDVVEPGSRADRLGLEVGDMISKICSFPASHAGLFGYLLSDGQVFGVPVSLLVQDGNGRQKKILADLR